MSESKHTPGPWVRYDQDYAEIVTADHKSSVAMVARAEDADLIAAAPDLLAACEAAQSWIADFHADARDWPDNMDALSANLRAAIEKARAK
jgi:hypothetical protein